MIFPAKLCGYWSLVTSTNSELLGSKMTIDYTNFRFSIQQNRYGPFQIRRNVYGSIYLKNNTDANILWSKTINYSIESTFLPKVPIPWKSSCPRYNVRYMLDDDNNELTIIKNKEKYVFQKHYVSLENDDHFYKIFFTQLLFDLIFRHLP